MIEYFHNKIIIFLKSFKSVYICGSYLHFLSFFAIITFLGKIKLAIFS